MLEKLRMKRKEEMQEGRVSRMAKCPSFCCCDFAWKGQGEILPLFGGELRCSLWPYNTSETQEMTVEADGE